MSVIDGWSWNDTLAQFDPLVGLLVWQVVVLVVVAVFCWVKWAHVKR